jgi:hypothetical protein
MIDRDIQKLRHSTERVKRLVNKVVAHTELDRRRIGKHHYGDLDVAIDTLLAIYKKYALLLECKESDFSMDDFDLEEDFAELWP